MIQSTPSQKPSVQSFENVHHGHNNINTNNNNNNNRSDDRNITRTEIVENNRRSIKQALIQDFSPLWFTWCMNTGIISILLHQFPQPWHFRGLNHLATIGFCIDLVLFIIFSILFLVRCIIYPRQTFIEITSSMAEISLLACWPIAWLTLAALTSLVVSEASWGGYWAGILAHVMWWFGAAWVFVTLFFVFVVVTRRKLYDKQPFPVMIIIPAVAVVTVAATGGLVAEYSSEVGPRLAVPVIIFGFVIMGLGVLLAMMLYTALWVNLMQEGWPPAEQTVSLFVLVGPMGQSSAALQSLASAATAHSTFASYSPENTSTFLQPTATTPLTITCTLLSLLMTGPAVFFTLFSIYCMLDGFYHRTLKWSLRWNSIIFPVGTLCTSLTYFSVNLDSGAFRGFTAVVLVLMCIVWFVNLGGTVVEIWRGRLLVVREDWRKKDKRVDGKVEGKKK